MFGEEVSYLVFTTIQGVTENIKLQGVPENMKLQGVTENIKLQGVPENMKLQEVTENMKLQGVPKNMKLSNFYYQDEKFVIQLINITQFRSVFFLNKRTIFVLKSFLKVSNSSLKFQIFLRDKGTIKVKCFLFSLFVQQV